MNTAIKATGAERIFVTHGYTSVFRRWLEDQGYDARIVATEYEGEYEGEGLDSTTSDPEVGTEAGTETEAQGT